MGFRYQELKDRGDSIELERKESFTTERSHNGYIKRRKTVLRERFSHPNAKEVRKRNKPQTQHSAIPTHTQRPATESARTTTETFGNSPNNATLIGTCRDKSHLERAVNRTSVQLKHLAHEIDNEISKLKRERDRLMFKPRPHPLMRNAAIQNDFYVAETPSKLNLDKFNTIADNIEFTIEKFSSQHKFVCTSPRYARDEQTSCRPRMRTIGLQKDTQRGSVYCDNFKDLKAKINTAIHYSATNLANLKGNGLLDSTPPNLSVFDYGGTGDGQNALKIYHTQNGRCTGGCNRNGCNCQKVCEHYNSVGNYNGMWCNKNTYVEKGLTPCSQYNYCRDEYRYDYPKQNNCVVTSTNAARTHCVPCQPCPPCQPCVPYLPPCPTYNESQPGKAKLQVIYGRQVSDLNTDEFYQPTGSTPQKRSPIKHGGARHSRDKERLTVDVPKDGRTLVDIERHDRRRSKTQRKKGDDDKTKPRNSYRATSPDKTKRQARDRNSRNINGSSSSADPLEKTRHSRSKEKLLEITFTKERRRKNSPESDDDYIQYALQKPEHEYSRETKRSMKQMTITAYKPYRPNDGESNSDVDQKDKNKRKSKDRVGDDKFADDKTWGERLRQGDEFPREPDWNAGIPTITEVYDSYRMGDPWVDEEDNVAKQQTNSQYVGGNRNLFHASPKRSYDIMPVQKNTVRDISPHQNSKRGQRSNNDTHTAQNGEARTRSRRGVDPRDGTKDDLRYDGQLRAESDYVDDMQSGSFIAYGLEEQPRQDGNYSPPLATSRGHEMRDKPGPDAASTPRNKHISAHDYPPDNSYDNGSPTQKAHETSDLPSPITTLEGRPRAVGKYRTDVPYSSERKYAHHEPTRRDQKSRDMPSFDNTYTADGKSRRLYDEERRGSDSPTRKEYEPHHPRLPDNIHTSDGEPQRAWKNYPDIQARSDKKYFPDNTGRENYEPRGMRPSDNTYPADGKLRDAHDIERHSNESYSHRGSESPNMRSPRALYDNIPEVQSRLDEKYEPHSPPRTENEIGVKFDTLYTPDERTPSDRAYRQDYKPRSDKQYSPDSPTKKLLESSVTPHQEHSGAESRLVKKYYPDSPSRRAHDPNAKPTPDTLYYPDEKIRSARDRDTEDQLKSGRRSDRPSSHSSPHEDKLKAAHSSSQDKISQTYRTKERIDSDRAQKAEDTQVGMASEQRVDKDRTEQKHEDDSSYGTKGQEKDKKYKYENPTPDNIGTPRSSFLKSKKFDTGLVGSPGTGSDNKVVGPVTSARTGKDSQSPGESEFTFLNARDVPEIKIEDLDDSGRSARSGRAESPRMSLPERAKFAIKGEMVLEPQQPGLAQYKINSESEKKHQDDDRSERKDHAEPYGKINGATEQSEVYPSTDKDGGGLVGMQPDVTTENLERPGRMDTFDKQHGGSGRIRRSFVAEDTQQLTPFPSLESPTIYLRQREACADYGTACLPPSNDSTIKVNTRVNCVENAGDIYMCKPRRCPNSPPSSPCRCLSPQRNGSDVPYEKLGDQYTHSPVRQLAANSHLAIALQPDAATGSYIPTPQPRPSKSRIYLRSTGTQYSATIIERQDDRCAPQYGPLSNHCGQTTVEAYESPTLCSNASVSPRQTCQTLCISERSNSNFNYLCDEENDEYEGKINFSSDQLCERVEIPNSEETQYIIAQEQQQQQRKPQSKCTEYNNFFLPWQQDQKFVPGQAMSDCNTFADQGRSQLALKPINQQSRYQSITDRRTARFNATMPPHQELPEEEARCALEMMQYKPQSRVKFMEQHLRRQANCEPSCYEQEEDINIENEASGSMHECTPRGRIAFDNSHETQQIPAFTGCRCMLKTYLNMITLYYPEYRGSLSDGDSVIEDAMLNL